MVYVLVAMFLCMLALKNKIAVAIIGGLLLLGIVFIFSRAYHKLKTHGIARGRNFFVLPLTIIFLVLVSIMQKLFEQ